MKADELKVIAIAGASSGGGRAMALHLAAKGHAVALAARRGELVEEIAHSIAGKGGQALPVRADMGVWEQAQAFAAKVLEHYGRIDVLVNNAGWGIRAADFDSLSIEEIEQGVSVNLMSVLYGCRAVIPAMKQRRSGHIINVSSILGKRSRARLAVYTACKHAVEGFSRSLLMDVNRFGIKVSILAPAAIRTEWAAKANIALSENARLLEPPDIAGAVEYLVDTPGHLTVWNLDMIALEQNIEPI